MKDHLLPLNEWANASKCLAVLIWPGIGGNNEQERVMEDNVSIRQKPIRYFSKNVKPVRHPTGEWMIETRIGSWFPDDQLYAEEVSKWIHGN